MKKKFTLDLRNYNCPLAFVKTRIFLDKTTKNEDKYIIVKDKKNLNELKKTFNSLEILHESKSFGKKNFLIIVKKLDQ